MSQLNLHLSLSTSWGCARARGPKKGRRSMSTQQASVSTPAERKVQSHNTASKLPTRRAAPATWREKRASTPNFTTRIPLRLRAQEATSTGAVWSFRVHTGDRREPIQTSAGRGRAHYRYRGGVRESLFSTNRGRSTGRASRTGVLSPRIHGRPGKAIRSVIGTATRSSSNRRVSTAGSGSMGRACLRPTRHRACLTRVPEQILEQPAG